MGPELMTGRVERLFTGTVWAEGPVWVPSSQAVRWSDIPNDRILEFYPATGMTREYATGVEFTNGRTLDSMAALCSAVTDSAGLSATAKGLSPLWSIPSGADG